MKKKKKKKKKKTYSHQNLVVILLRNGKKYWIELSSLRQKPTFNSVCFYYGLLNVKSKRVKSFVNFFHHQS